MLVSRNVARLSRFGYDSTITCRELINAFVCEIRLYFSKCSPDAENQNKQIQIKSDTEYPIKRSLFGSGPKKFQGLKSENEVYERRVFPIPK